MYKILVIGAVQTTAVTIKKLVAHDFNVVGVLGHEPLNVELVSGWTNLNSISKDNNIDYFSFKKINNQECLDWAIEKKPDIIFAVGFSQLLKDEWLQMPKLGCIGFHPTKLPEGRGRAPLAWITLEKKGGAANFFLMGQGADDGPIFTQSFFDVYEEDDAKSVEDKIVLHIEKSLDQWLPDLKKGVWDPKQQDHNMASWYGKRGPEDGWIDWNKSAKYLDRLIKASSHPHPGAYSYCKDSKLVIWKSQTELKIKFQGVVGRVVLIDSEKGYLIQCGEGLLWINDTHLEDDKGLRVGDKLGYNIEDEIYNIKKLLKNEG
jgi:methionyl-tRNA formyltransferase